ncbi:MAG: hypothetical protein ACI9P3_002522 [Bradyrhizobium sp.]|jgi:hypothetical protein
MLRGNTPVDLNQRVAAHLVPTAFGANFATALVRALTYGSMV